MTTREHLARARLFQGLSEGQLDLVLPLSREVALEQGATVFREGERARCVYTIGSGRVVLELTVRNPQGAPCRPAVVDVLGPGEALGWSAIVAPHVFTLTAKACEPCTLVSVNGEGLRELLRYHRDFGYLLMANVTTLLAERLARTREMLIYERGWAVAS